MRPYDEPLTWDILDRETGEYQYTCTSHALARTPLRPDEVAYDRGLVMWSTVDIHDAQHAYLRALIGAHPIPTPTTRKKASDDA